MRKMSSILPIAACALGLALLTGCKTAQQHAADVQAANTQDERISVGTVQREIKVGMSSADVVSVLGSPNMVTTDSQRRENWVYDKISTEQVYSASSGGVNALILGGALIGNRGLAGGAGGAGYQSGSGAAKTSQRTLTIIIKFDENSQVRDFAYRYSSF